MTSIRWSYSREFSRRLGKEGTGKGRARRNDVKVWAMKTLDSAASALTGDVGEDE